MESLVHDAITNFVTQSTDGYLHVVWPTSLRCSSRTYRKIRHVYLRTTQHQFVPYLECLLLIILRPHRLHPPRGCSYMFHALWEPCELWMTGLLFPCRRPRISTLRPPARHSFPLFPRLRSSPAVIHVSVGGVVVHRSATSSTEKPYLVRPPRQIEIKLPKT